jgi:hypothetical protein
MLCRGMGCPLLFLDARLTDIAASARQRYSLC